MRDFSNARRKAAEQLGLQNSRNLPGNDEIESALLEYQQLFHPQSHATELLELRKTALQAMKLLQSFSPRLVGPVLSGSADQNSPIYLHLFADSSEAVGIFLLEHKIPYQQSERRVRYSRNSEDRLPLFRFFAGEHALELTVFPTHGQRQAPLSPVDGKPMQRANTETLKKLIKDTA